MSGEDDAHLPLSFGSCRESMTFIQLAVSRTVTSVVVLILARIWSSRPDSDRAFATALLSILVTRSVKF